MESAAQPEQLNPDGFAAFSDRAGDGSPVVMLNLLAFKPDGGRERYEEYGAAVAPLLEKVGGRIEYQAIAHLRTEAPAAGELHPMDIGAGA